MASPASRHRRSTVSPSTRGKPKVEHHGVVVFRPPEKIGPLAVGGAVDRIPGLAERRRELARQARFVFDDKDPHLTVIAQPNLNGT